MAAAARKLTLPALLPLLQADLQASLAKACEERDFLRSLNDTLLANQRDYKAQALAGQQALAARDAQVVDLQEQVRGCLAAGSADVQAGLLSAAAMMCHQMQLVLVDADMCVMSLYATACLVLGAPVLQPWLVMPAIIHRLEDGTATVGLVLASQAAMTGRASPTQAHTAYT